MGGVVYHGQYLAFADMARTELLRSVGINFGQLYQDTGTHVVVKSAHVDYRQPARLDDKLVIKTTVESVGGASVDLVQKFYLDLGDMPIATVAVKIANINQNHAPVRWADCVKDAFNTLITHQNKA